MNRADILQTAESLINGDRDRVYGDARENFIRIGNLWAEIFGHPVTPEQVALAMNQVKVARLVVTPDHRDSWIDGAGYFALGGEIATSKREPRQWPSLDDVPHDVDVVSRGGARWHFYGPETEIGAPDGEWLYDPPAAPFDYRSVRAAPFTEVISE